MLAKYDNLIEEKKEIETYYNMLNEKAKFSSKPSLKNSVICITKSIMFLTTLARNRGDDHYSNAMIGDILLTMNSLTHDSIKCFYALYRSFIENYLRFVLELDERDTVGIRELFRNVNDKFAISNNPKLCLIFNYFEGEYGKCCLIVHSNVRANIKIQTYYKEILNNDEINENEMDVLLNRIETFLKFAIAFIIHTKQDEVEKAFFRKKQKLKYFLSDANFRLLNENSN